MDSLHANRTTDWNDMGADIDVTIGKRIKQLRNDWNMSQSELAEKIDVSFQQVQKYEKGITGISVSRLIQICQALQVPVEMLLSDESKKSIVSSPVTEYGQSVVKGETTLIVNDEEKKVVQLFRKITNKKVRDGLIRQLQGINEIEKNQGLP